MTHSINGDWRGHYTYRNRPDAGSSFDAFFFDASGRIEGSINDDESLGEAVIAGTFSFPKVQFTKTYLARAVEYTAVINGQNIKVGMPLDPVEYEGTMSDDGKTMSGAWMINSEVYGSMRGNWTAHRLHEDEEKKEKEATRQVKQPQLEEL